MDLPLHLGVQGCARGLGQRVWGRRGQRPAGEAGRLVWHICAKWRYVNFRLKRVVDRSGSVLQKGIPLAPWLWANHLWLLCSSAFSFIKKKMEEIISTFTRLSWEVNAAALGKPFWKVLTCNKNVRMGLGRWSDAELKESCAQSWGPSCPQSSHTRSFNLKTYIFSSEKWGPTYTKGLCGANKMIAKDPCSECAFIFI